MRGAWVEIVAVGENAHRAHASLPVRGAWVEIPAPLRICSALRVSLPVRGAWVEMSVRHHKTKSRSSRSPCGERGLKCGRLPHEAAMGASLPVRGAWVEICRILFSSCVYPVAPRAGSVGWNLLHVGDGFFVVSLPVRGAWVEMPPSLRLAA